MLSQIYVLDTSRAQIISPEALTEDGYYIRAYAKITNKNISKIEIAVRINKKGVLNYEVTGLENLCEYFISGVRASNLVDTINNVIDGLPSLDTFLSSSNVQYEGASDREHMFTTILGGLVHQIMYYTLAFKSPIGTDPKAQSFCDSGQLPVLPAQINSLDLVPEALTKSVWAYTGLLTYVYSSLFVGLPAVLVTNAMSFMNIFGDYFVNKKQICDVSPNDAIPVAIRVIYCAVALLTQTQISEIVDSRDEVLSEISQRLRYAIARIEDHADDAVQEVKTSLSSTVSAINKETTKDQEQIQKEVEAINSEIEKANKLAMHLKDMLKIV